MDKHLVFLVKQTERYTEMLVTNLEHGGEVGLDIHRVGSLRATNKSSVHVSKKARLLGNKSSVVLHEPLGSSHTSSPDDLSSIGAGNVTHFCYPYNIILP